MGVAFTAAASGSLRLTVHDVLGREVAVLAEGVRSAGRHALRFDTEGLAAGVYLLRLTSPDGAVTGRFTVVR